MRHCILPPVLLRVMLVGLLLFFFFFDEITEVVLGAFQREGLVSGVGRATLPKVVCGHSLISFHVYFLCSSRRFL